MGRTRRRNATRPCPLVGGFYNFDYGYVEDTRADDGDDTDAMILLAEPTFPKSLDGVSPHRLREIEHVFATYKLLEDKRVEVDGWAERDAALAVLDADRRRWLAERVAAERHG